MQTNQLKHLVLVAALAFAPLSVSAQAIGQGNTFNPSTDQVGIARGATAEGYVTWDSFTSAINAQLPPDNYIVSGSLAAGIQTFTLADGSTFTVDLTALDDAAAVAAVTAALNAHIAADADTTADSFTSTNGTISNAGTSDALDLDVVMSSLASTDSDNAITIGTDGGLFAPSVTGGLTSISTDSTLGGSGTSADPLGVTLSYGAGIVGSGSPLDPLRVVGLAVAPSNFIWVSDGAGSATWQAMPAGGDSNVADMVTDVTLARTDLNFVGQNGAFSGTVDLSSLPYGLGTVATSGGLTGDGTAGNPVSIEGLDVANSGEVFVADGSGSGSWSAPASGGSSNIGVDSDYIVFEALFSNGPWGVTIPSSTVDRYVRYSSSTGSIAFTPDDVGVVGVYNNSGTLPSYYKGMLFLPAGTSAVVSGNPGNNGQSEQVSVWAHPI